MFWGIIDLEGGGTPPRMPRIVSSTQPRSPAAAHTATDAPNRVKNYQVQILAQLQNLTTQSVT